MEFQLAFPLAVTLLLLSFIFFRKEKMSKLLDLDSKLPPSPWKIPLIGHLHHLLVGLPHQSLRNLAKTYGPLTHLKHGEVSAIIISTAKMAEEVMKRQNLMFINRPEILSAKIMSYDSKGVVFSPYSEYWRQIRKICVLELLSVKRVQSFRSVREEEVSDYIENISLKAGSLIDHSEMIFSLSSDITSRASLGNRCKDKKVDAILKDIIRDHRINRASCKGNDGEFEEGLVDLLLTLQEKSELEYPFTEDHIKVVILDIFMAGSETASTTIEWAMLEILRNSRVMKRAQGEVRQALKGKEKIQNIGYLE
ncbi:hypothetical protein Sjap_002800 [Stephania japonica]|uniref:Cytochrome P450 n=1 Tax=Stephania japonica TaxID=461633 RepID=A0AAP0PUG6_9MAGN